MSIATKHGDGGQTGLAGGIRVSKSDARVECYGTVDELNAALGFARSLCSHAEVKAWTLDIQKTLFRVGSALATPPESRKPAPSVTEEDAGWLTNLVHNIESREGILSDWSIPGESTEAAAYEMARTICRRAERAIVRLIESGQQVQPQIVPWINRLSDAIWLFARLLELEAGVRSGLRDEGHAGARWSRAW